MENADNPLRCPVRLYEFYLSKCSESVKQRTNLFYLHPERCCVPNSPLWFSSIPLDDSTMEAMLTRILTVRELHLRTRKVKSDDPPYIPDEEDGDSDWWMTLRTEVTFNWCSSMSGVTFRWTETFIQTRKNKQKTCKYTHLHENKLQNAHCLCRLDLWTEIQDCLAFGLFTTVAGDIAVPFCVLSVVRSCVT